MLILNANNTLRCNACNYSLDVLTAGTFAETKKVLSYLFFFLVFLISKSLIESLTYNSEVFIHGMKIPV